MQIGRRTVYTGGFAQITVKKSRFIAQTAHIEDETEAEEYLDFVRKKYHDARHHCFAFITSGAYKIVRSGDDGEPQGSAGKPILTVLEGEMLQDTILVVTRYFGGVLLGVGGLVRAYTEAARAATASSVIIEKFTGIKLTVTADYTAAGKLIYYFEKNKIPVISRDYAEKVSVSILPESDKSEELIRYITDLTNGAAQIMRGEETSYAYTDGRIEVFPDKTSL